MLGLALVTFFYSLKMYNFYLFFLVYVHCSISLGNMKIRINKKSKNKYKDLRTLQNLIL